MRRLAKITRALSVPITYQKSCDRLMRQGYVLVTGPNLTGVKRFLTPEQIEGVFSQEMEGVMKDVVRLRVTRGELLNI